VLEEVILERFGALPRFRLVLQWGSDRDHRLDLDRFAKGALRS
jgi:hypothetical protein